MNTIDHIDRRSTLFREPGDTESRDGYIVSAEEWNKVKAMISAARRLSVICRADASITRNSYKAADDALWDALRALTEDRSDG